MTAAVTYALRHGGNTAADLTDFYRAPAEPAPDDCELMHIRALLEQCGAKAWLEHEIADRIDTALRFVPQVASDPLAEAEIATLVSDFYVTSRPWEFA